MSVARRIVLFIAAVGLVATVVAPTASAHDRRGPVVTPLASFGDGSFVTGSTIGPDGALYVTDGSAGSVLRIDRRSGRVTTYATGLPTKAFATDIGGPVDVVFVGRTAYVLVTLVSGEIVGGEDRSATPTTRTASTASSATAASRSSLTSAAGRSTTRRNRRSSSTPACSTPWSPTTVGSWSLMDTTTGCCGWTGTARSTRSRRSETSCRPGSK